MRGHQPQRLLGEAGAATHTGAEEVQSGGFGAACGPLGLAEGLEGVTPGRQSPTLMGQRRIALRVPGCWEGLGVPGAVTAAWSFPCCSRCFAILILFIRLRAGPSFPILTSATHYQAL